MGLQAVGGQLDRKWFDALSDAPDEAESEHNLYQARYRAQQRDAESFAGGPS